MRISLSKLRHRPVVTERGTNLGHVIDVELDVETHTVLAYLVQSGMKPFGTTHRVAPTQVVSITSECMVVKDTVIPAEGRLAYDTA